MQNTILNERTHEANPEPLWQTIVGCLVFWIGFLALCLML